MATILCGINSASRRRDTYSVHQRRIRYMRLDMTEKNNLSNWMQDRVLANKSSHLQIMSNTNRDEHWTVRRRCRLLSPETFPETTDDPTWDPCVYLDRRFLAVSWGKPKAIQKKSNDKYKPNLYKTSSQFHYRSNARKKNNNRIQFEKGYVLQQGFFPSWQD